MALLADRCPVEDRVRRWIDDNTGWLRQEFGEGPLTAPVILPRGEFFPPPFGGTDSDVRALVARIAGYMGAQNDISVDFKGTSPHSGGDTGDADCRVGRAGRTGTGQPAILRLDRSAVSDQRHLIALIAHSVGRARLMVERRVAFTRKDLEPLTDLATVYLGMGLFTVKAPSGMNEQQFGYALGRYTLLRGDAEPAWATYLDAAPRRHMRHAIRYLQSD